jgi:hypothetical protein
MGRFTSRYRSDSAVRRLLALLMVLLAAACNSSGSPPPSQADRTVGHSPPQASDDYRLDPLTEPEQAACRKLAENKSVTVLCPSLLPRPKATNPPNSIGVRRFPVCREWEKRSQCPLYDFAVLYGAPDESPGHASENTPVRFLHFEILGGDGVGDVLRLQGLASTGHPFQHLIGTRTIAGRRGHLYFGLPYNQGGGQFGSHYTFVWEQAGTRHAASLHSWTPHTATIKLLEAIIGHVVPVRP